MGQTLRFDVIEQTAITRFYDHLPHHPSCGDSKPAYLIRSKYTARKYPYIQANPPGITSWLTFDIDHGDCWAWMSENLPAPNLIVRDRETGRGHISYAIVPVCTSVNGRAHPKQYLKAVRAAMAKRLRADAGYTGRITKNPLCDQWLVTELHSHEYSLGELHDYLKLEPQKIEHSSVNEDLEPGRNSILFLRLRYWAYAKIAGARSATYRDWENRVFAQAHRANSFKSTPYAANGPLEDKEVDGIAKSVARWVWNNYTTTRGVMELAELKVPLSSKQRLSARRTHEIRTNRSEAKIKQAIASLAASGETITKTAVSRISGISRQQLTNRYEHLFAPSKQIIDVAEDVKFGVNQISALGGALDASALSCESSIGLSQTKPPVLLPEQPLKSDKFMNIHGVSDSRSGGKAAFSKICGMLAIIEKIHARDGTSPRFGYRGRARITRVILSQKLPLIEAELFAGSIADLAVDPMYSHMTIADWCAYCVVACRAIKQKIDAETANKTALRLERFDSYLRGECVHLSDSELPELVIYAKSKSSLL